jgi:hypothetical protein
MGDGRLNDEEETDEDDASLEPDDDPSNDYEYQGLARLLRFGVARERWEPPELLTAVFIFSFSLLVLGGVVGGIVGALADSGIEASSGWYQIYSSTGWAGFAALTLLFGAVAVLWWQISGWSEVVAEYGEVAEGEIEAEADEAELATALNHLLRARWLATLAGVSFVLVAFGAATSFIAFQVGGAGSAINWANVVDAAFEDFAILVLSATGLICLRNLRRTCDDGWSYEEGPDEGDESVDDDQSVDFSEEHDEDI